MKKGCLAVLAVLAVIVLGGGVFAAYEYNHYKGQFGLDEAPAISYAQYASPETRVRAVLNPEKLTGFIQDHIPPEVAGMLPSWSPVGADSIVAFFMPREVALTAGSDYRGGKVGLELFVNERRGGPVIVEQLAQQNPLANIPAIQWDPNFVTLAERGALTLKGAVPIPEGLEDRILQTWDHDPGGAPIEPASGHLLALCVDNRNGEILTLAGSIIQALGENWEKIFQEQAAQVALTVIETISYINGEADLKGNDELGATLRIFTKDDQEGLASMLTYMGLPTLQQKAGELGLTLDGNFVWDKAQSAIVGTFTLTGFEPIINAKIREAAARI